MRYEKRFYDAMMEEGRIAEDELKREYEKLDADGKNAYHEEAKHQFDKFYQRLHAVESRTERALGERKRKQFEELSSMALKMAADLSVNIVSEVSEDGLYGSITLEAGIIVFSTEYFDDPRWNFAQMFLKADDVIAYPENELISIQLLYKLFDEISR